ncbi:YmfQ family protein [Ferrovibrio sp.]|uniref:YmfQ family protein n=1 Tax=Ferrovibrio sp. TaxID=1917215 RepID=UPI0035B19D0F
MERRGVDYYRAQLLALLPQGLAWPREPDTNLYLTLEAYAVLLSALQNRLCDLREEADPRTTSEGLVEWETDYGLPDPCAGDVQTTVGRRARLLAAVYARGGADAVYFEQLAARLGHEITITEYKPFRVGQSRVGDPLWDAKAGFVWRVDAPSTTIERFKVGKSRIGDALGYWSNAPLECAIRHRRPRHTAVVFRYSDPPNDYGRITDPVELVIDYGRITDPVTDTRDYGVI